MKKLKRMMIVILLMLPIMGLSGCVKHSVTWRANHVDTWSQIKKRGKLTIGVDDSFVPMDFRKKNGQLVGYDVDLSRAVCKVLGIKADFQSIDWSMKETELKNGTIDVIWNGYTATPARRKRIAFSRVYELSGQSLVVKKDSGINKLSDMQGKVLGVQQSSTAQTDLNKYPKVLKNYIQDQKPILYQDNESAFLDLQAGRIQGVLAGTEYAGYYATHIAHSNNYKLITTSQFPQDRVAVGMRKGDVMLRKKINYALGVLQKNGTLRRINKKWLGIDSNYLGPVSESR
ncbi:amino acid ABC transporter substrate-binding protein [Limosilactobacillus mucosae]|uniref:amino acid ABC transporter substrate-binding protein n=1 Tax=Limosilactobacillus mucosae TaxID=97478 RepID=UPI00233F6702|nr:amino acid ABC transporter substrate-binding protein [Limosilactobacillus mucosae]MDC2844504.1 amino acid ABC transporter substrate-binding protein [Limosilactobacillus mucosae]